ncbi:glycosyltransferase family 4 protein [Nocardia niigatensis]
MMRLIVVGHGAAASGFSRVSDGIISQLIDSYDIHQLAVNHPVERLKARWPVYGNPPPGDIDGVERLGKLCRLLRPDLILIVGDLFFSAHHIQQLYRHPPIRRPLCVAYCPVDGELHGIDYVNELAQFDQIVVYNRFGSQELSQLDQRTSPTGATRLASVEIIPHGIDRQTFHPIGCPDSQLPEDRGVAKELLFGADSALRDSFIVFNGNKHQPRKRLDLTIEGFARFARGKPANVRLYLHASIDAQGPDLRIIAAHFGIADRLILTGIYEKVHPAVTNKRLNLIYNACDVGINTSMGEGWGLVAFEHAVTGAPQIVPRHSACRELWDGAALLLDPVSTTCHPALGMLRHIVDPCDVAAALEQLYGDQDLREHMARAAFERARQPQFSWPVIAGQWDRLFRRLLESRQSRYWGRQEV